MTSKGNVVKAFRAEGPHEWRDFETLKIGFAHGTKYGGFIACDGPTHESATLQLVLDDQADLASTIAPFADLYWAPAFKIYKNGAVTHNESFVQTYVPRGPTSVYIRRPCILISTNNAYPEADPKGAVDPMTGRQKRADTTRARRAVAEVAYKVLQHEMLQLYGSEYLYRLAETLRPGRITNWTEASNLLSERFSAFLTAKLTYDGPALEEDQLGGFAELHKLHERIWAGRKGRDISRIATTLVPEKDLRQNALRQFGTKQYSELRPTHPNSQ